MLVTLQLKNMNSKQHTLPLALGATSILIWSNFLFEVSEPQESL